MSATQTTIYEVLDRMKIEAHSPRLEHRPSPPIFDGATFDPARDEIRLSGQLARVYNCMSDGEYRTLQEIRAICGGSEAGLSARLRDLRKTRWGAHVVNRRRRTEGTFEYSLQVNA